MANKTTVISNRYFDLFFYEREKIIHHVYKPPMSSAQLKDQLTTGTQLLRESGATKWISDNRQVVNTFDAETTDWVNNVWLPETVEAGWKYWALIVPEAVAASTDHIKFVESFYNSGVWVTVWTNFEEAYEWITAEDKD